MIYPTLEFLRQQLNEFLDLLPGEDSVVLGDIARMESPESGGVESEDLNESVILTLIRTEEETTLSNRRHYTQTDDAIQYHNQPLHLNLYLMASANFRSYATALMHIDQVIQFFVTNKVFTNAQFPTLPTNIHQLFIDFYDPGFEQLSYIWSPLGGKAFPSALYKIRLVAYYDQPNQIGQPIDAIGLIENAL